MPAPKVKVHMSVRSEVIIEVRGHALPKVKVQINARDQRSS